VESREHGNETSGSIKSGKFPDQLSNCRLSKNGSAHGVRQFITEMLVSVWYTGIVLLS